MVLPIYYYGWQAKANLGWEWASADQSSSWGSACAAASLKTITWPRAVSVAVDENVTREYFIGMTSFRDADTSIKGIHEATGTLTYWLPDDMSDSTAADILTFKLPIDQLASYSLAGSNYVSCAVPSATHGSSALQSFTLEIGHSASDAAGKQQRWLRVSGCKASSFTMRARAGEPIEVSMDWQGRGVDYLSGTAMQAPSRETAQPLGFGNVIVKYGNSNSTAALSGCTAIEFTLDNNLIPVYGLTQADGTAAPRVLSDLIPGRRDITGTMTVHMASGNVTNDLWSDVLSGAAVGTNIAKKEIQLLVSSNAAAASFGLVFHGVRIGEMTVDIDPTKVQEISVPWMAEEIQWNLYPSTSTSLPTNFVEA